MNSIVLLCSGNLGAIVLNEIHKSEKLIFVFTDKGSLQIIDFCKKNEIPFHAGNPRNLGAKLVIQQIKSEILLSVNYLFICEEDLISAATGYAINFHGSLLPKYRGRTPHVWAIINGEKETGITAHLMNVNVDDGPIIKQVKVNIDECETGSSLLQKFNEVYPQLIKEVINDIIQNKIVTVKQDHSKATYFGKRTPADGEINWNWQKEQIRNWVRAQAQPYPGAFTFYENNKIIVNKIEFSEVGFHYDDTNGKILQVEPDLVVKTPNGAVRVLNIVKEDIIQFQIGKILSCQKS